MTADEARERFAYNTWANRRLLDAARPLSDDRFTRDTGASFGSIHQTLLHILAGEWKWLRFWRGEPYDQAFVPTDYPTVAALESHWAIIAADQQTFAAHLTEDQLQRPVAARGRTHTLADTIQHLLNHSTYHRGQVVTLLRQGGCRVPSTDFLDFLGDAARLRASTGAIRSATTSDADAIAALLADAFVEFQPLYTAGGYRATTLDREEIQKRLTDGPIWVAEQEGRITGTVSAMLRPDGVYVRSMAVAPVSRGSGIGRLLLNHVQDFAAAQDRSRLYLSTTPFLASAIRFYEQAGFVRTSAPPYELFGTALFTMEKWSGRADVR